MDWAAHFAIDRHWRRWLAFVWLCLACGILMERWSSIGWFVLPDTDDNMRMMQVRGLLGGQGWYDLRQYRLDPPGGASIHWSRLVDLPIAGLILVGRLFVDGAAAERMAVAVAPMLAMAAGLAGIALAARRLVDPRSWPLAVALLVGAGSTMAMWKPLRIDHHGWQLALLILMVAGIADRGRARGGIVAGLATAASLTIGLELMPYMALGGALLILWWVAVPAEAPRVRAYAASLAGGSAAGFLAFASYDNRLPVCDALSPVWLSATLAAGGVAWLMARAPLRTMPQRLAAAAVAGAVLAVGFALAWPQCLARPEHLSPELTRDWFDNVREAKPVYQHGWRIALQTLALPLAGAAGAIWAAIRRRSAPWAIVAILSVTATALLFWQTRAGPAAQLLAVPGATAAAFAAMAALLPRRAWLAVPGVCLTFFAMSGLWAQAVVDGVARFGPAAPASKTRRIVNRANARCPSLPALRPIARLPKAVVLTFVDLGPRLITVTHHDAIAGPYHRNAAAILDIHRAFRRTDPAVAHDVMRRHGATLLLICPGMSEMTLYATQDPKGFYMQLQRGRVPAWLAPVPLPASSPFRLWRRVG
ncbi:MAG: AcrB/AcrD/AcrF family protein [Sphingomonas fennica]